MAFAVPLHHVGAFFVVDIFHAVAGVGTDAFAVQPRGIRAADAIGGESAQMGHGHCLRRDAGPVAEDAAAGRRGKHGVAEAVDEIGRGGRFAKRGDEVCGSGRLAMCTFPGGGMLASAAGVEQGHHCRSGSEGASFNRGKGDVALVVGRWPIEDGEFPHGQSCCGST